MIHNPKTLLTNRGCRSVFTGLLTYEISRSVANLEQARHCVPQSDRRFKVNAGVAATLIMAIIPAHLMRR